ncbi:MAG: hypothetical protein NCW75_01075 [Phycisphaera sp.]|nr:MAG: hypothetical protein NCW75_01075 [Phycisphaera sp.]
MLLYIGIDEAGYGPMLGPLCVGVAAMRLERWKPDDGVPDLWSHLKAAVCKSPRDSKARLAVADSKKLCKPMAHGAGRLAEAERSVLGFVQAMTGAMPRSDRDLFEALAVTPGSLDWYAGEPTPCPAHADAAEAAIAANALCVTLKHAGVGVDLLRVARTDEARFNAMVAGGRSKANTTLSAIAEHAPHIIKLIENAIDENGRGASEVHTRIVIDRQGGRTRYEAALSHVFGRPLRTLAEAAEASTYEFADLPNARIRVQAKAEDGHFPVALASMQAKLVRELSMERFNAFWSQRRAGVKPTAGYTTDARRWLADMDGALSDQELRSLIRLA